MTELLPGDFGLVPVKGIAGLGIRLGQFFNGDGFANYEHSFIFVGNGQIIEAEPGGARLADLAEYSSRDITWSSDWAYRHRIPVASRQNIADWALTLQGVDYSGLDYLDIALNHFRATIPGLNRYVVDSGHLICSQLVAKGYREYTSVQDFKRIEPQFWTPAKLGIELTK